MKAPLAYLMLALAAGLLAWHGWPWAAPLLWPAAAFGYVAALYPLGRPGGWRKRPNGRHGPVARGLLWPVRATLTLLWHAARRQGDASNEVVTGIHLGRRPLAGDVPGDVGLVIDLTSEFAPVRDAIGDRRLIVVPTLDYRPPDLAAGRAALDATEQHLRGGDRPGVLIHCAAGYGRSATLAAALLVRTGHARDVAAAIDVLRDNRPGVRLTPAQHLRATELATNTNTR